MDETSQDLERIGASKGHLPTEVQIDRISQGMERMEQVRGTHQLEHRQIGQVRT